MLPAYFPVFPLGLPFFPYPFCYHSRKFSAFYLNFFKPGVGHYPCQTNCELEVSLLGRLFRSAIILVDPLRQSMLLIRAMKPLRETHLAEINVLFGANVTMIVNIHIP